MKNIRIFYLKIFIFLVVKFSVYLNRHVFVMDFDILRAQYYIFMNVKQYFTLKQLFVQLKSITKTCLYYVDPLQPHFYIAKLGCTGVYINFLIFAQNIDCGYTLEPPRRGGSNEYHNVCF